MSWFENNEKKAKRKLLNKLQIIELKKITKRKKINIFNYNKKDIINEILDKSISIKMIKNYFGLSKRLKAKAGKIKSTENNVYKLLNSWKPSLMYGEYKYKNDLYLYLIKRIGREFIRKESGIFHADIAIKTKKNKYIPIELKFNFSMATLDRLNRQIKNYKIERNYKGYKIYIIINGIKSDDGWGKWFWKNKYDKRLRIIIKNKKEIKKI